ncbi:MAG: type II toxin-antitoxin system PemK/MazF family toxin [Propionibacteriaceae bacterium]|nr:type II toxin-antitoxin system PemK/MazF family toxin [Propionibacteriaceae bacterium]
MLRGQVVRAHFGNLDEPKLFVVVSNNVRNRVLGSVLAARLTTTRKPVIPSIVEIPAQEGVHGRLVCDDIEVLYQEDVIEVLTGLTPKTMEAVDRGVAAALGLH